MKALLSIFTSMLFVSLLATTTPYFQGEVIVQIIGDYNHENEVANNLETLINSFKDYELQADRELSKRMCIWLLTFNNDKIATSDLVMLVKSHPAVNTAQHNHKVSLREIIPNDHFFDLQWGLQNIGQNGGVPGADISATLAWEIATGGLTSDGKEIVIAIIDDGFDLEHPDIDFWKNLNETPGNGLDDDNNGYIDDYHGWNAYNNSGSLPVAYHGTHVTGIAAAIGNNDLGISGVNWGVKVMPVAGASFSEAVAIAAYGYVLEMRALYNETDGEFGAYVVATNSSFGVDYGDPVNYPLWGAMYDSMGDVGILSVASTMNSNVNVDLVGDIPTNFPSPYLLGVTNTTRHDLRNPNAAYGAISINLGAPGTQIFSTVPGGDYFNMSGTSMSSPHVTGAIALLYAAASNNLLTVYNDNPGDLALFFRDIILESVDQIPALENITSSGGRLNIYNALQMLISTDRPDSPEIEINIVNDQVHIYWDHVAGANSYQIYQTENPDAPFPDGWLDADGNFIVVGIPEAGQPGFIGDTFPPHKFYRVVASTDFPPVSQ